MKKDQILIIVIVLLLLLLGFSAWWGYSQKSEKEQSMLQNVELTTEISDLNDLKASLETEIDSLQVAYSELATENESLQGTVEDAQSVIRQKEKSIRDLKKRSGSESGNLKAQIEELLGVKSQLESNINDLKAENASLRAENEQLTEDLAESRAEKDALSQLNSTIQDELKKLTLATFKASGFRVEVEKKKAKATAKSRRARRLNASFDLVNVPAEYQGLRTLYLVITDDKGTPIKVSNPINTTVKVNDQAMNIQAVDSKEEDIVSNQRIAFAHNLEERLKTGYYRVAVYTDIGLLGASSFRLR